VIQLTILNGKQAGARWVTRRFAFEIGRSPEADLRLDDDGVWNQHLRMEVRTDEGAALFAAEDAFLAVNGHQVQQAVLRNGDLIQVGSVQLLFGLSPTTQYSLRFREALSWTALGALGLGQVALIYWMIS
jgi:pSer/pThr/pTyr-binding forkhead associated (FHA) protein